MGTNTLGTYAGGDIIPPDCVNQYKTALNQDIVPRNTSGVATDNAGDLGDTTNKWRKAHINSGYWHIGDIKAHHSYNGLIGPGEGFMLCDGRLINETNYDSEHGSGHWDDYIVSSALDGKYLPDLTNKYPVGASTTTQDGSSSITSVGNSSHQTDSSHTHTMGNHTHSMQSHSHNMSHTHDMNSHTHGSTTVPDNSGAKTVGLANSPSPSSTGSASASTTSGPSTANTGAPSSNTSDTGGSATLNIKPESIEVQYYMRII